ncbi:unnamed protein product [Ilex paraguariensis]|uniref:Exopolygalacturonase-like n=1 Tax=Ilex paraguariensis TaxID=185542 RepID=A0ABC8QL51_9AQUA
MDTKFSIFSSFLVLLVAHVADTQAGVFDKPKADIKKKMPPTPMESMLDVQTGFRSLIARGKSWQVSNEEPVVGIFVKNCTLINTMNGVRVKTWPASPAGVASDMHFEDIIMQNVGNPVLIDQQYCPYNQCKQQIPSRVKISKVSFKNIRGTSSTQLAVPTESTYLKSMPCQNVEVGDIHLTYNGKEGPAMSTCANVKLTLSGKQNPPTCTNSV